ncbi:MAG: polysaccharide deacetylase family protein [Oscillospiraceae bacterium]|jgi:peptidoglycan/xylan/chitin deacetylase (PgdA/CDA1 family)|nr:polysaccharide deacetylase family protein [Oscillospiraceae bacterium]
MQKKIFAFGLALLLLSGTVYMLLIQHMRATAPKLLVLTYHHLTKEPEKVGAYTIAVDNFEADLQYLKSHGYETITPTQFLEYRDHQVPLPDNPVMITFDDGYESVYAYAYPLLRQYQMNACAAIVGEYTTLYTEANDHNLSYSYMTWPEVLELQESGVIEIANHSSHLHIENEKRKGCQINPSESLETYRAVLQSDLGSLQDQIQHYTGKRPVAFVYPFGLHCDESYDSLTSLGFRIAFTCEERWNLIPDHIDSLLLLGRFNRSGGIDTELFFQRIV